MERDYGVEIDELKKGIAEIKELLNPQKKYTSNEESKMNNELGTVSYFGHFKDVSPAGANEAKWHKQDLSIVKLMGMPKDKVSVVLSSLGNQQRWEILSALLIKPMTVAQIVEEFEMKTSGKAYHHLNVLMAADLLEEDKNLEKGTYKVKGHRVQGIIMIMTGVYDLINPKYSKGEWIE